MNNIILMSFSDFKSLLLWRDSNKDLLKEKFRLPLETGEIRVGDSRRGYSATKFTFISEVVLDVEYRLIMNGRYVPGLSCSCRYTMQPDFRWAISNTYVSPKLSKYALDEGELMFTNTDCFQDLLTVVMSSMAYMMFCSENCIESTVSIREYPAPYKKKGKVYTPASHCVKVCQHTIRVPNTKRLTKKHIKRVMQCWGVRGHYRHYSDGKVVFIKPYYKGEQRDDPSLAQTKYTISFGGKDAK